jgi:sigma-B regulation protein RsbU (phosphoserine phosphatase)
MFVPFFDWFRGELYANFSARRPMRALFHSEKSLPAEIPRPAHTDVPALHGAELAAVYYGTRRAGDFYDFLRVSPDRVLFGLLDAAGGLEQTRAIVSAAQTTFRTSGVELFAGEEINEANAVMELCLRLNQVILKTAEGVHSCPAFAGCYNENLGLVSYFNAGHTPGLLRDPEGISELPATGLPLGLFSHSTSDAGMVAIEPGAVLLLASRGIVEGKCKNEEFGLARVKEVLARSNGNSAETICRSLLDQVQDFMCAAPTHDDVTALALARDS